MKNSDCKNYWITTHFPPLKEKGSFERDYAIYLPDGREAAGEDIAAGDYVLIYESLTGRTVVRKDIKGNREVVDSYQGVQGIVAVARVLGSVQEDPDEPKTKYKDGTEIWWKWRAETVLESDSGFVVKEEVNKILGYKPKNLLKGFGDLHSGLKKITRQQFFSLLEIFKQNAINRAGGSENPFKRQAKNFGHIPTGESQAHKDLKYFVAANPAEALQEAGLKTFEVEHPFATQDKADIVLLDALGRYIGVEIELNVDETNLAGILQAVKYRYMLAVMYDAEISGTRSFLVAHSINEWARKKCDRYNVECFVINKEAMRK